MQRRVSHAGAAHYLKQFPPAKDDPKVEVPGWARPQINAAAAEMIERLVASGVRIVGDPAHLVPASPPGADDYVPPPVHVSPTVAGRMAMGVLHATGATPWAATGTPAPAVDPLLTATLPTIELEKALARRARNSVRRRLRQVRAAVRPARSGG
jgi:hypothetical protein